MVEETGDGATGSSTGPGPGATCIPLAQDCPAGYKCAAYATEGSPSWNEAKCVPVVGDGVDGEPCTAEGLTGVDSCAKGYMCWNIEQETGFGTCVAQCSGTWGEPMCSEPWTTCVFSSLAVLALCLPTCSPLLQMCEVGEMCLPSQVPNSFVCVPDASGDEGQLFDPCEYANACDPGLVCTNPELAVECDPMAPGCCLPFCEIGSDGCPGAGQECLPWYMPGEAPPMLENVGICGVPQ